MQTTVATKDAFVPRRFTVSRKTVTILLPMLIMSGLLQLWALPELRAVLLPTAAIASIALGFFVILWNRERSFPLFNLGTVTVAVTACYALVPLLGFIGSGLTNTLLSDPRLYLYGPTADDLGAFAWLYVVYLGSLAAAYLLTREQGVAQNGPPVIAIPRALMICLVSLLLLLTAFLLAIGERYGVDLSPSYDPSMYENYALYQTLPLPLQQVIPKLQGVLFVLKLGLMVILLSRWRRRAARWFLVGWLLAIAAGHIVKMGARTELALLVLGAGLLYHRLIRPLSPLIAVSAGSVLLILLLLFGLIRGGETAGDALENLATLGQYSASELLSAANEFQTAFAGTYDLYRMQQEGIIGDVPWQIYATEILMLVPQQLLPFVKIHVQSWYLDLAPITGYFIYGPVAQAILGLGWVELVARGAILGWLFGRIHCWCMRRTHEFWPSLFYIWLMVWSYYTVRASTFYFVVFIVYSFLPAVVLVGTCRQVVAQVGRLRVRKNMA